MCRRVESPFNRVVTNLNTKLPGTRYHGGPGTARRAKENVENISYVRSARNARNAFAGIDELRSCSLGERALPAPSCILSCPPLTPCGCRPCRTSPKETRRSVYVWHTRCSVLTVC